MSAVTTLGCRLNSVESEAMARAALAAGLGDAPIVNTCAVTVDAARKSRAAVRRVLRETADAPVFVTGCASTVAPAAFAGLSPRVRLVANDAKATPATWRALSSRPAEDAPLAKPVGAPGTPHTRGFVAVQNGCDHRCTFCIIPFGRGASRSIPAAEVIAVVRDQVAAGVADVVLTGVDLTAWGLDLGTGLRLGDLVHAVLRAVPKLARLRLSSLDCIEVDARLLDLIAREERLMPHLHLSLQAGDDLVLKRMRRRHTRAQAVRLCETLRARRPDLVFGADLIAGFPTETDAMAARTLALAADCGLTHLHVFPYSPRPGTPAARMPPVPRDVVEARAKRLREEGGRRLAAHLAAQVGRRLTVLVERGAIGRAADFTPVAVSSALAPGTFAEVAISGHDGERLIAAPQ